MAKADAVKTDTPVVEITLTEFCTSLSKTDKRVELIGGFNAAETKAGHLKDAESNVRARFTAFINKPV